MEAIIKSAIVLLFTIGPLLVLSLPILICFLLVQKKDYKNLSKHKRYAGFWWRFLAALIDWVLLMIAGYLLGYILPPFLPETSIKMALDNSYGRQEIQSISFIIVLLYFVLFQSSKHRATLGMQACRIKIGDEHFNKLGFWRLTGRHMVSYISVGILFIGVFMIAFTKRKQSLHDLVARTIVLKE